MIPTPEQARAVEIALLGESMKIKAFAGSGKTATLGLIGNALAPRKGTYVAFNKAIATDAARTMPETVKCRTFHSLAYAVEGYKYRKTINMRLNGGIVAYTLNLTRWSITRYAVLTASAQGDTLISAVRRFCRTMDPQIEARHIPHADLIGLDKQAQKDIAAQLVEPARRLWALMSDPNSGFPSPHDIYVKVWAMGEPNIDGEFILFDEAQDADPLMLSVVLRQQKPVIWVGDPWQSIYQWRGAVDAMTHIDTPHEAVLSLSFRFGQAIANVANTILSHLGERTPIVGNPEVASWVGENRKPKAILARTNASVVAQLFKHVNLGRRVAATGVTEAITFFECAQRLKNDQGGSGPLALFHDYDELVAYAATDDGSDLATYISLEREHGIERILPLLRHAEDYRNVVDADVVISTAHRSKGLQWPSVRLCSDFKVPHLNPEVDQPREEDIRLLYVAMTRAQRCLDISAVNMSGFTTRRNLVLTTKEKAIHE
jgi:hypothetical protein